MYKSEFGYKLFKFILKPLYILKYKPTIIGKENIPLEGPIILCSNHKHVLDQCNVIIVTKRVIHYMAKEEYFEKRGAWFFKFTGCIKVDRRIHDEVAKGEALDVLKEKKALGIFPEGTRNKTLGTKDEVDLLPFKYGAVSLAMKTGALIVPYGIRGEYTGKNGNLVTKIGKPIDIKGMSLEDANKLLRKKILELMKK